MTSQTLTLRIAYYLPLLTRYARCLVIRENAAAAIAAEVLEDRYEADRLCHTPHLRLMLQTCIRRRAHKYLHCTLLNAQK